MENWWKIINRQKCNSINFNLNFQLNKINEHFLWFFILPWGKLWFPFLWKPVNVDLKFKWMISKRNLIKYWQWNPSHKKVLKKLIQWKTLIKSFHKHQYENRLETRRWKRIIPENLSIISTVIPKKIIEY